MDISLIVGSRSGEEDDESDGREIVMGIRVVDSEGEGRVSSDGGGKDGEGGLRTKEVGDRREFRSEVERVGKRKNGLEEDRDGIGGNRLALFRHEWEGGGFWKS